MRCLWKRARRSLTLAAVVFNQLTEAARIKLHDENEVILTYAKDIHDVGVSDATGSNVQKRALTKPWL